MSTSSDPIEQILEPVPEVEEDWIAVSALRHRRYLHFGFFYLIPFLLLSLWVWTNPASLTALDVRLSQGIIAMRSPGWNMIFRVITEMAGIPFLVGLVILTFLLFWKLTHQRAVMFWFVLTVLAGSVVVNPLLKLLFNRPRPAEELRLVVETTNSFPSGHSLSAIIVYGALAYALYYLSAPRRGWGRGHFAIKIAAIVFSLAVAYSRVYLGAHYPSDVIAGLSLGASLLYFSLWFTLDMLFPEGRAAEESVTGDEKGAKLADGRTPGDEKEANDADGPIGR